MFTKMGRLMSTKTKRLERGRSVKQLSVVAATVGVLFLFGCTEQAPQSAKAIPKSQPAPTASAVAVARNHDFATVTRGAKVFQANCATCHGDGGQGHPTWQKPGPDGKYPAPPLNGTGHAWHHPTAVLKQVIKQGTLSRGGSMPAWGDKLSDEEIDAAIEWFKSKWPDELYAAWARMDAAAGKGQ